MGEGRGWGEILPAKPGLHRKTRPRSPLTLSLSLEGRGNPTQHPHQQKLDFTAKRDPGTPSPCPSPSRGEGTKRNTPSGKPGLHRKTRPRSPPHPAQYSPSPLMGEGWGGGETLPVKAELYRKSRPRYPLTLSLSLEGRGNQTQHPHLKSNRW